MIWAVKWRGTQEIGDASYEEEEEEEEEVMRWEKKEAFDL